MQSGYRITLTYNLLLHGDTSRPEGDEGAVAQLAGLLREHFNTPVPHYDGGPVADPPSRLVYLLNHEYTPRALTWTRLKGDDGSRVSLLRSAAERAGCETVLTLANVKTTHSAFEDDYDDYRYGQRWDEGDDGEDEDDGDTQYEIQELIDSEVALTHWTGPDGNRLEETSLFVDGSEVCASTPTGDLTPYESQYEGYMGNCRSDCPRAAARATCATLSAYSWKTRAGGRWSGRSPNSAGSMSIPGSTALSCPLPM